MIKLNTENLYRRPECIWILGEYLITSHDSTHIMINGMKIKNDALNHNGFFMFDFGSIDKSKAHFFFSPMYFLISLINPNIIMIMIIPIGNADIILTL